MSGYEPLSLTKVELVDALYEEIGCSRREATEMVEGIFELMKESLEAHDSVKITGFGAFRVLHKEQRFGRNIRTGDPIAISARHVVSFRTSQLLRDTLNPDRVLRKNSRKGS